MKIRFYSTVLFTCLVFANLQAASLSVQPSIKAQLNIEKHRSIGQKRPLYLVKSHYSSNQSRITARVSQNTTSPSTVLAAGFFTNEKGAFPLIARSENGGSNWSYVLDDKTLPLPEDFVEIALTPPEDPSMSCGGQDCVVVLHYQSSKKRKSIQTPLFITTHDGGRHWSYTFDRRSPGANQDFYESITDVSCDQGTCVAAGGGGEHYSPLLLVSQNAGSDWNSISTDQITSSLRIDAGEFESVSCDGLICVAGGNYYNPTKDAGEDHFPVIAISKDKGLHWAYTFYGIKSANPDWFLNSVTCHEQYCVAGGFTTTSVAKPILITSQDYGAHWNYVDIPQLPNVPADLDGYINKVYCDALACSFDGFYSSVDKRREDVISFTGTSNDSGSSWQFSTEPRLTSYPNHDSQGEQCFFSEKGLNCSGSTCIISGSCDSATDNYTPFVAMSWDNGASWQFPVDLNTPSLPSGFKSADLSVSAFVKEKGN